MDTDVGTIENGVEEAPEDWVIHKIGEVCHLVKEHYTPESQDIRNYIGLEHIAQGSLRLIGVGKSTEVESNKFVFRKGQILFGKLRPYFRKVYRPKFDGVCSTDIFVIDGKEGFDNGFLFYFFANPQYVEEATMSSDGTKMPRASWDYLSKLEKAFPRYPEQRAIAKLLTDIDDKIELNEKMNNTLEAIGQAIFKHWFIDFEFPDEQGRPYRSSGGKMVESELGEIPEGWKVGNIDDVAQVVGGGTPSTKNSGFFTERGIPWLTPKDLSGYSYKFIAKGAIDITKEGLENSSVKLMPAGTILFTSRAPIGYIAIALNEVCTNQGFKSLVPKNGMKSEYLYQCIKRMTPFIKNISSGSTFGEVSGNAMKELRIIIPAQRYIDNFEILMSPINLRLQNIIASNGALSEVRDLLLPKLMSGKIRVPISDNASGSS